MNSADVVLDGRDGRVTGIDPWKKQLVLVVVVVVVVVLVVAIC